jgi:hypothetical protein
LVTQTISSQSSPHQYSGCDVTAKIIMKTSLDGLIQDRDVAVAARRPASNTIPYGCTNEKRAVFATRVERTRKAGSTVAIAGESIMANIGFASVSGR